MGLNNANEFFYAFENLVDLCWDAFPNQSRNGALKAFCETLPEQEKKNLLLILEKANECLQRDEVEVDSYLLVQIQKLTKTLQDTS